VSSSPDPVTVRASSGDASHVFGDQPGARCGTSKQRLGTSRDVSATVVGVPAVREAGELNEPLRRALLRARLREDDVAARLGVDPKTVRRWLNGRIPYANNRAALADLVGAEEADLWPDAAGPFAARVRPEELEAVYPHRWAVPREVWTRFFASAEREIGILAYSALFLAEDAGILRILADKGHTGITVRIALGDPDSPHVAERGAEEGIGDAMPAKIRNALTLLSSLHDVENIEIRLHRTPLYNSIFRADNQIFVNQHAYGLPAAHAPVFCFKAFDSGDIVAAYLDSFERVWAIAERDA
jgi:transcriptional regulator with XRE-family HTH domain